MARTDDDSWDITEGVGSTALGVAMARAGEANSECPLFVDDYAQKFVDAAVAKGWTMPDAGVMERLGALSHYAAARTRWFDEYFIAAAANGVDQAVILAAGLDARAWRLPWVDSSVVYEIDLPKVLQFKTETVEALPPDQAKPAARYVAVPADLRQDWPQALRDRGFDPGRPTAWAAEGLLPYLSAAAQDRLFEQICDLSAPGSRVAVESFGPTFFDPVMIAQRRERAQKMREESDVGACQSPDPSELWYIEERNDVAEWLEHRGWEVSAIAAQDLLERYTRCPDDETATVPDTVYIDGTLGG